jgi:micrococcal nuclease
MHIQKELRLPTYLLATFLFFYLPLSVQARDPFSGKVVGVTDGDTITGLEPNKKTQFKIRLYGIDTPEKQQPFGTRAKQFTSDLCFGKTVQVETVDTDRYGRTVALVKLENGILVNEEIVRAGFAWVYGAYCKRSVCLKWNRLEDEARAAGLVLWKNKNPVEPRD